jgi:hypothetical protein
VALNHNGKQRKEGYTENVKPGDFSGFFILNLGGVLMDDKAFERLIDSFDDFKERLIRIDENVKAFGSVKEDVDVLKVELAQVKESAKSSHKRMDSMEAKEAEREKDIKWLKRQIIIGFIGFVFTVLGGILLLKAK